MARSILLVGLGTGLPRELRRGLTAQGFRVQIASGVSQAVNMAAMHEYAGILLCSTSRDFLSDCLRGLAGSTIPPSGPIICLADLAEDHEAEMLAHGCSSCLGLNVSFNEVLAQLRALIAIAEGFPPHFRIRDLGVDPIARRASKGGQPLHLRPREFDLLAYLAERSGCVVSAQELHQRFWPGLPFSSSRVAVQIHNLRRALGAKRDAPLLQTLRPGGYILCDVTLERHGTSSDSTEGSANEASRGPR